MCTACGLVVWPPAAVLLVIFLILRFTSVKIPIGPFFLVTSILMAVLVVIFAVAASMRSSRVTY